MITVSRYDLVPFSFIDTVIPLPQVPKHLGKVNGCPVFGALHISVNEIGEVRTLTLTPTKAHDQCMPSLSTVSHSLRKYGHGDVELVYTDNVRGDKAELEQVFPSLRRDILPVPSSSLESLSLPDDWEIHTLSSPFQINSRLDSLMENLADIPSSASIHVAVDMEWSVDRENGIHGRIALIQLAYRKCIYLIPVCHVIF